MNPLHHANQKRWEAAADNWAACADSRAIWNNCLGNPGLVFTDKVLSYLADICGKKVCVLGSGDNEAVFALTGLGAQVTSVDISAQQLAHAAQRAKELDMEITFVQSDVTDLHSLPDNYFDMVYTGGHVAVWVSNLTKYYQEAVRILQPGGLFLVDEYHPFRRVWQESDTELKVGCSYFKRGPFKYMLNDDVLYKATGELESFEFHWTVADYINAMLQAGCQLLEADEYGEGSENWENAPMAGLPEFLLLIGKKNL